MPFPPLSVLLQSNYEDDPVLVVYQDFRCSSISHCFNPPLTELYALGTTFAFIFPQLLSKNEIQAEKFRFKIYYAHSYFAQKYTCSNVLLYTYTHNTVQNLITLTSIMSWIPDKIIAMPTRNCCRCPANRQRHKYIWVSVIFPVAFVLWQTVQHVVWATEYIRHFSKCLKH